MEEIDALRREIDIIDKKLVLLINERVKVSSLIGNIKTKENIAVIQKERENKVFENVFFALSVV